MHDFCLFSYPGPAGGEGAAAGGGGGAPAAAAASSGGGGGAAAGGAAAVFMPAPGPQGPYFRCTVHILSPSEPPPSAYIHPIIILIHPIIILNMS